MISALKLFFAFVFILTSHQVHGLSHDEQDEVEVTLARASVVGNKDAITFVERCMELAPEYYRFTTLPRMTPIISGEALEDTELMRARVQLSAYDSLETFLGWYFIYESQGDQKQLSGLLGLDTSYATDHVEVSLIYLPPSQLLHQSGLTSSVLDLTKAIVEPKLNKPAPFLKEINEQMKPVFEDKEVKGICASIYCRNYPSLISAWRAGFRPFCLIDSNLLGHEIGLAYPPYEADSNEAIEEHLGSTPGMRANVARADWALELLENRRTRYWGKLALWNIHLRSAGVYTALGWIGAGTVALIGVALKCWK